MSRKGRRLDWKQFFFHKRIHDEVEHFWVFVPAGYFKKSRNNREQASGFSLSCLGLDSSKFYFQFG